MSKFLSIWWPFYALVVLGIEQSIETYFRGGFLIGLIIFCAWGAILSWMASSKIEQLNRVKNGKY